MKTILPSLFGATLLLAGGAASVSAGTISTPILFSGGGNQHVCIANNVSSVPVTVRVTVLGNLGGSDVENCTLQPNDTNGCQAFLNDQAVHCRISVAGQDSATVRARLRGVLINRTTVAPFTIFATVEAR
jgi:hypothetical protein